jgi:hypothetical protein
MTKEQKEMAGGIAAVALVGILIYLCTGFNIGVMFNRNACKPCQGSGKVLNTCFGCSGHGYVGGARCGACGGRGRVEQTCRFCAGSGRKP